MNFYRLNLIILLVVFSFFFVYSSSEETQERILSNQDTTKPLVKIIKAKIRNASSIISKIPDELILDTTLYQAKIESLKIEVEEKEESLRLIRSKKPVDLSEAFSWINNGSYMEKKTAIKTLAEFGESGEKALVLLLEHPDGFVVRNVKIFLIENKNIFKKYFGEFVKSNNFHLKKELLNLSVHFGTELLESMEYPLKDTSFDIRLRTVWILGQIKSRESEEILLSHLKKIENDIEKIHTISSFINQGPQVIPYLLDLIKSNEDNDLYINALVKFNNFAKPPMFELLKSEDEEERQLAIYVLARIGGEEIYNKLNPYLYDVSPEVREVACWAMAKIKATNAIPLLEKIYQEDKNKDVKDMAKFSIDYLKKYKLNEI